MQNEYNRLCLPESYSLGKEADISKCFLYNMVNAFIDNRQGLREYKEGKLVEGGGDKGRGQRE